MIAMTEEREVISFTCWRCGSPLLGAAWIEAGLTLVCVCGGWTRLPLIRDGKDAIEHRRQEWARAERGDVETLIMLGKEHLNQKE